MNIWVDLGPQFQTLFSVSLGIRETEHTMNNFVFKSEHNLQQ